MATFGRLSALRQGRAIQRTFSRFPAVGALALVLFLDGAMAGLVIAQSEAPIALIPKEFSWRSLPDNPALQSAWVLGDGKKPLAAGGRIPPHTHPDERNNTVLQGVLYVGFGRTFDESKLVAIPIGAVCVIPAEVPHYVWAKDGDVVYQEAGVGVTATIFIDAAAGRR